MASKVARFFRILVAGLIALHFGAVQCAAGKGAPSHGCPCAVYGHAAPSRPYFGLSPVPHAAPQGGMSPVERGQPWSAIGPAPAPPPGTLGRTYRRPTRLIPEDEHPRVGMLEVRIPRDVIARNVADPNEQIKVSVRGLDDGYVGDDGLWHFEAEELIPGVPHIYDVNFEVIRLDKIVEIRYGRPVELERETKLRALGYRTVRLIPGRIVELTY